MSHGNQQRKRETGVVVWEEESRGAQKDRQAIWKDGGYKKKRHKEDIIYTDFGTCGAKPT